MMKTARQWRAFCEQDLYWRYLPDALTVPDWLNNLLMDLEALERLVGERLVEDLFERP